MPVRIKASVSLDLEAGRRVASIGPGHRSSSNAAAVRDTQEPLMDLNKPNSPIHAAQAENIGLGVWKEEYRTLVPSTEMGDDQDIKMGNDSSDEAQPDPAKHA